MGRPRPRPATEPRGTSKGPTEPGGGYKLGYKHWVAYSDASPLDHAGGQVSLVRRTLPPDDGSALEARSWTTTPLQLHTGMSRRPVSLSSASE